MRAILKPLEITVMSRFLYQQHARFGLLWNLGITTGLRIGDLLALTVGMFLKPSHYIKEQKTGKERLLDLPPETRQEVEFYVKKHRLGCNDYLFFSGDGDKRKPMSRQWAHRVIARTAKICGLDSIGAHSMRKIYACNIFAATGSILAVQGALNHEHPSTTMEYLKDFFEDLQKLASNANGA